MAFGVLMTLGTWLLLTFFFCLLHHELVVARIDNFETATLDQEVTVMVFLGQNSMPPVQDTKEQV